VRYRVLGTVELEDADGSTRAVGSGNQRTVLAALVANRGHVVTADTLIGALWGDNPPPTALATLRTYVSRLRAQIGDVLRTRGSGFMLDVPANDVDAGRFELLLDAAQRVEAPDAIGVLDEALSLWRGQAFGDQFDVASVRGEVKWSEAQLSEQEQSVLAELSVFGGPVGADDVGGVLPTPGAASVVRRLADRSLVSVDRTGRHATFGLLQTVRAYADARLRDRGHVDLMARRHADWFVAAVETADGQLRGADEPSGHRRLGDMFNEVRAAHRWARQHDVGLACRLSAGLHLYAQSRLVDERLRWAEELVEMVPDGHPYVSAVLASAATRAIQRGDLEMARRLAERGVAAASDGPDSFGALEAAADSHLYSGRLDLSEQA